jgi:hypothetical protein
VESIAFEGAGSLGSGYGSGSGSGYGYGYGDGSGYAIATEAYYASLVSVHSTPNAVTAIWCSTADGKPANGGSGAPVKAGDIQTAPGPLSSQCGAGQLHATFSPHKWKGEKWWIVRLHGEIAVGDDKLWALKREIVAEFKPAE